MWEGFIGKEIKKGNRNLLITNLFVLLIPLGIFGLGARYWYNFLLGPFPVSTKQLSDITNADTSSKYYLKVQGQKSFDSGFEEITTTKRNGNVTGSRVSAKYVALILPDKILIVKATVNNINNTQFTGYITPVTNDVQTQLINEAETKDPRLKGIFLPYILNEEDFTFWGYVGLAIGLSTLALGGWNIAKFSQRNQDLSLHPTAQRISKMGDLSTIIPAIESEVSSQSDNFTLNDIIITASWFLQKTFYGLDVIALNEIVWIYQQVTQHRTNGIPTGKTYMALIYTTDGQCWQVPTKDEPQAITVLEAIFQRVPWVLCGYNEELVKLWHSDKNQVIGLVYQRLQEFNNQNQEL